MIYLSGQGLAVHSMKESQTRVKKKSEETEVHETTKAAAWAVFQHRNGGGSNSHRHHGVVLVQQATRFKIEAQMKNELERRFVAKEALPSWDASSTLFDKYELDSVFKHLDFAFQSADTQKVCYDGSEYYDESASAYSFRDNHYPGAHAQHPQQISDADLRSQHGYCNSEEERPNQQNWLEAVSKSQRFRGNYLETVDESLALANVQETEHEQEVNGYGHEESPKPKLVMNMTMYDDICKQAIPEVVPQWKVLKTVQFLHAPNRWNSLQGRYSFDTSPKDVQKDSKQSRKAKLLNMFKSKSATDSTTTPKPTRQARIVPDDFSLKGRKVKPQDPLRKSGELVNNKVGADTKDSDVIANGDGYEAQGYPLNTKGVHQDQVALPLDLKSGLHSVLVPNLSRTVRLSSDMRNPNVEEGFHNHLSHGDLTHGPAASPGSPGGRRKKTYSLNAAASPVRTPRRSMLTGSREDLDSDDEEEYHEEYHHHYHHHHHHIANDDYELTVQDIVKRASRKSFEDMAQRFTGCKAPRNSFENPFLNMPVRGKAYVGVIGM